jgi:beta-lactamase class A
MADLAHRRHLPVLLAVAAAALLSGCGGDDEPAAAPTPPPTTATTTATAPRPAPRPDPLARAVDKVGGPAGAVMIDMTSKPRPVGSLRADRAWSTIKVPLLVAYLDLRGGAAKLTPAERADATQMITVSANAPANRLFLALADAKGGVRGGARAVERVLRRGGDERTQVTARPPDNARTFTWLGQTVWRLADGARWHRALFEGRVADTADTRFVLGLMRRVTGSDWGLRTAVPSSEALAYKVGLGATLGGAITAEQYGIVGSGDDACVIGIVARAQNDDAAKDAVTRIAKAAVRPAAGCGPAPARG